jgi:hypothetical protein
MSTNEKDIKLKNEQNILNEYLKRNLEKGDIGDSLGKMDELWGERIDNFKGESLRRQDVVDKKFEWDLKTSLRDIETNPRLKILLMLLMTYSDNLRREIQINLSVIKLHALRDTNPDNERVFGFLETRTTNVTPIRKPVFAESVQAFAPRNSEINWINTVWTKTTGSVKDALYFVNESVRLLNMEDLTMEKSKRFTEAFAAIDLTIEELFRRILMIGGGLEATEFIMIGLTLFIPHGSGVDFSKLYDWVTPEVLDRFKKKWSGIGLFDETTIPYRTEDTLYALVETANELSKTYKSSRLGGKEHKYTPSREIWLGQSDTKTQWNTVVKLVTTINDDINSFDPKTLDKETKYLKKRINFFIENNLTTIPVCYICGGALVNNSSEIEHVLPFAQAIAYTTLAPSWPVMVEMYPVINSNPTQRINWAKDRFGFLSKCLSEYALAHNCCNRIKSDVTWVDFKTKKPSIQFKTNLEKIHSKLIVGVRGRANSPFYDDDDGFAPTGRTKPSKPRVIKRTKTIKDIQPVNLCNGPNERPTNINDQLKSKSRWVNTRVGSITSNYLDFILDDYKQVNTFSISGLTNLMRVSKQCSNKLKGVRRIILSLQSSGIDMVKFMREPVDLSLFLSTAPVIVPTFVDKTIQRMFTKSVSSSGVIFSNRMKQNQENFEVININYSVAEFNNFVISYLNSRNIYNINVEIQSSLRRLNKHIFDIRGIMFLTEEFFKKFKYVREDNNISEAVKNSTRIVINKIRESMTSDVDTDIVEPLVRFYATKVRLQISEYDMFQDAEEDIFYTAMEDDEFIQVDYQTTPDNLAVLNYFNTDNTIIYTESFSPKNKND